MVMAIRLDALQPIDLLQLLNDVFAQVDAQDPTVRHLHSKPPNLVYYNVHISLPTSPFYLI